MDRLKAILSKHDTFDAGRIPNHGADLEEKIRQAIQSWENRGRAPGRTP